MSLSCALEITFQYKFPGIRPWVRSGSNLNHCIWPKMKIDYEDKHMLMLSSFLISVKNFKDSFIHGRESIVTLDKVQTTVRVWCPWIKSQNERFESWWYWWRSECFKRISKSMGKSKYKGFDKSRSKLFIYHKVSHFKKDYTERVENDYIKLQSPSMRMVMKVLVIWKWKFRDKEESSHGLRMLLLHISKERILWYL